MILIEHPQHVSRAIWAIVRALIFGMSNHGQCVRRIAIEVNKLVKFIVKIVKHLYRSMTDFVFHISLLLESIVTDFFS